MTVYSQLKDKIKTKLQAITQIQEVHDEPTYQFEGYPAVTFYPIESDDSKSANTTQDDVYYNFQIDIFHNVPEESNGIGEAIDTLYNTVDYILDPFRKDAYYSGLTLPSGYTFLKLEPISAGWEQDTERKLLIATIKLKHLIRSTATNNCI